MRRASPRSLIGLAAACLVLTAPAARAQEATPAASGAPDLTAMALLPADLPWGGFGAGYGYTFDAAGLAAWHAGAGCAICDPAIVTSRLEKDGFIRSYWLRLGDQEPGAPSGNSHVAIISYIHEFAATTTTASPGRRRPSSGSSHIIGEQSQDRSAREQLYGAANDVYYLEYYLPGSADEVHRLFRFPSAAAATAWLTSAPGALNASDRDVRAVPDAPMLGDQSSVYVYARALSDTQTVHGYRFFIRVGATVAVVQADSGPVEIR